MQASKSDPGANGAPDAPGAAAGGSSRTRVARLVRWLPLLGLPAWLLLFTAGLVVNTRPLVARYDPTIELTDVERTAASSGWIAGESAEPSRDLLLLALCYTPSNVALLCLLSAVLGVLGAQVRLGSDREAESPVDTSHPFVSGVMRGFFVYLVVLSGLLVVSGSPFSALTSGDYLRMAGLVSVLSFSLNYAPDLFVRLLGRVQDLFESAPEPDARPEVPVVERVTATRISLETAPAREDP